ncbi:hypothetical protein GCM10012319_07730 [Comamonas sp. KCTC 72670]|nr:hypothetical protein GCM10012319_07730 [Comamonas sp. KCTC 72670]
MPLAASIRRKRSSGRLANRESLSSGAQASGGRGVFPEFEVVDMRNPSGGVTGWDGGPTIHVPAAGIAAPFSCGIYPSMEPLSGRDLPAPWDEDTGWTAGPGSARLAGLGQPLGRQRKVAQADARRVEEGVAQRRRGGAL